MKEDERRQTTKGTSSVSSLFRDHLLERIPREDQRESRKESRTKGIANFSSRPGIWMSKGDDIDVLVMDVEGTDGRERGEDQDFERKSALFSIAVSEVLIVNIWEHQVGLYQGANMGLLKTVFEVNLGLFLAAKEKGKISGS